MSLEVVSVDLESLNAMSTGAPYGYPFVMLDRVEAWDAKRRTLTGLKCVPRNELSAAGHLPGHPIFPACC